MKEKVEQIIEMNIKEKNEVLNLSYLNLGEIPKSVFKLNHLKVLKFMGNNLSEIPTEISELKSLSHLYLYQNKIKSIPFNCLKEMYSLECVDLGDNFVDYKEVQKLYKELDKLKDYKKLIEKVEKSDITTEYFHFWGNTTKIPNELFNLKNLKSLSISGTNISEIPKEISQLKKLERLSFSGNNLSNIPSEIYDLENLTSIDLDNNQFVEFPERLLEMKKLESISFNYNKIERIKPYLDKVVKNDFYTYFSFGANPLKDFESEMFRGGMEYIKEYVYGIENNKA